MIGGTERPSLLRRLRRIAARALGRSDRNYSAVDATGERVRVADPFRLVWLAPESELPREVVRRIHNVLKASDGERDRNEEAAREIWLVIGPMFAVLAALGAIFLVTSSWLQFFSAGMFALLFIRYLFLPRDYAIEVERLTDAWLRVGRCPTCVYPLASAAPDEAGLVRCPECGAVWRRDPIQPEE